jgi:hypothetical protein
MELESWRAVFKLGRAVSLHDGRNTGIERSWFLSKLPAPNSFVAADFVGLGNLFSALLLLRYRGLLRYDWQ